MHVSRGNGPYVLRAASGDDERLTLWTISSNILMDVFLGRTPTTREEANRWAAAGCVRRYRRRFRDIVAGPVRCQETIEGPELDEFFFEPRSSAAIDLVAREIEDLLFALAADEGSLARNQSAEVWELHEPLLRSDQDPVVRAVYPKLVEFHAAYAKLAGLPQPQRELTAVLKNRINQLQILGTLALWALDDVRHHAAGAPPSAGSPATSLERTGSIEVPASSSLRVFISYSHDSPEHALRVFDLANRLRAEGVDAWIDQYESAPAQGWPRWMQQQIEQAYFILVVCTATYRRRFEGKEDPGRGKGVTWEGLLAQQVLYEAQTRNERLVPVLFDEEDEEHALPIILRPYTRYRLPSGYEALYRRLTGQPAVIAPPVGLVRAMPLHGPSTLAGAVNDASSGASHEPVAIGPLPTRSPGLPDRPNLASEKSGRVPDKRIPPLEEESGAFVADAGRATSEIPASLDANDIQHVSILARNALQVLEPDSNVCLSVVVQKCIRIARLRNDLDNLWWLRLEMTSLGTRISINGPGALKDLDEDSPKYYSSEAFQDRRRAYIDTYVRDRTIWGAERLDGSSLPELESKLASLSAEVADSSAELEQVRRMGRMRLKDLRELEQVNAKHMPQLMEIIRNCQIILQRIRHRVHEFLTRTEIAVMRQG